ncbi:hypothetical protein ACRAWF_30060 [Streptomyces sp. L7]
MTGRHRLSVPLAAVLVDGQDAFEEALRPLKIIGLEHCAAQVVDPDGQDGTEFIHFPLG